MASFSGNLVSTTAGAAGYTPARPMAPRIRADELTHERLINTVLLERSGGGDLYRFRLGEQPMVYKHIKEATALRNVCSLMDRWAAVRRDTDWVRPERLINLFCGRLKCDRIYLAIGSPLHAHQ